MITICQVCGFPTTRPQPVRVGTLNGEAIYKKLCNVCTANARRSWSAEARRQQADREDREAQSRYGE